MKNKSASNERSREWFDDLYSRHKGAVMTYVLRRGRDYADDVCSETFMTAWAKRDKIPEGFELPWLYRTASFHLSHAKRSASRRSALADKVTQQEPHSVPDFSGEIADQYSAQSAVDRVMAELSESDARVLRLWAWEGLDAGGIAVALGIAQVSARVKLSRAKKRAKKILEAHEVAAGRVVGGVQ